MWLDYVADSGDGFDATTTIASLVACDLLNLPDPAGGGPTRVHGTTRAGAVLVLGGDQAYPFATMEEYRNRLVGPFRCRAAVDVASPVAVRDPGQPRLV